MTKTTQQSNGLEIAIIAMAGRFPGAKSVTEYWENLKNSRECLSALDEDYLRRNGVSEEQIKDPDYVKTGGILKDADHFDAQFFGYSPREAKILDPQHRVFLECAWEAMETAGYNQDRYQGPIGVFAGTGMSGYLLQLCANQKVRETVSPYELFVANDKDFLCTRVSYKLNLTGPSIGIQTACSSSLVSVHAACQSLLSGDCDMALAGGVAISRQVGYPAQKESIYSEDGHCRAFDANANGTVGGNGVGIVVLKRLEDAIKDGDVIEAVIKGSAVTNDGSRKVSFTAPQSENQAAAIRTALTMAETPAESISYIEAHGTGTPMGDPIEMAGLMKVFPHQDADSPYCAIGSVKTNIGHLDTAAGIAGLIKTILALRHQQIPASLHYHQPNPQIDFEHSPFYVNTSLKQWKPNEGFPRRAGVSSFGIGGSNAHVVLEEWVGAERHQKEIDQPQIIPLSARSESALHNQITNLSQYLKSSSGLGLQDIAFTLQEGRQPFPWRSAVTASSVVEVISQLDGSPLISESKENPSIVFLLPGQGSSPQGWVSALLDTEPTFKDAYEESIASLEPGHHERGAVETECLELFSAQYALFKWANAYGIKPAALLGHSFGEWVAACIAGVFELKDAVKLVSIRGRLMDATAAGSMTVVMKSPKDIKDLLGPKISIAAHNAPDMVTLSGPTPLIEKLEHQLKDEKIPFKRLDTTRPFHSESMDSILAPWIAALSKVSIAPPNIPFLSNVSGNWIKQEEAMEPAYWGRHLREPVAFHPCVQTVLDLDNVIFIELGDGQGLGPLIKKQTQSPVLSVITTQCESNLHLPRLVAELWMQGAPVKWELTRSTEYSPQRLPLPTYPFERRQFLVEPRHQGNFQDPISTSRKKTSTEVSTYYPSWRKSVAIPKPIPPTERQRWLLFLDEGGIGNALADRIERSGKDVIKVRRKTEGRSAGFREYLASPNDPKSFEELFRALQERETQATHIMYLWALDDNKTAPSQELAALADHLPDEAIHLFVCTTQAVLIETEDTMAPLQSAMRGVSMVIGQEKPNIGCRWIDIGDTQSNLKRLAETLWEELRVSDPAEVAVAYRGQTRWILDYESLPLTNDTPRTPPLIQAKASYLILGDVQSELGQTWAASLLELGASVFWINTHPESKVPPSLLNDQMSLMDAATSETIQAAIQSIQTSSGMPQGIFVCSDTANKQSAAPLTLLQKSHWEYNEQSKRMPLEALASCLDSDIPKFVCAQSSLSSIIGGIGLAAYSGTNHQVDAMVAIQNQKQSCAWYAINWDHLTHGAVQSDSEKSTNEENPSNAIEKELAWKTTLRILTQAPPGQYIVSLESLYDRLEKWVLPTSTPTETSNSESGSNIAHDRPKLANEYRPPANEIERTIVEIWEDFLGIKGIGVDDNFYALGGHSLLAIQVISRLREVFPIEIELRHLVTDEPTPARIARILEAELPNEESLDEMADLLDEIKNLSPEETKSQLESPHSE